MHVQPLLRRLQNILLPRKAHSGTRTTLPKATRKADKIFSRVEITGRGPRSPFSHAPARTNYVIFFTPRSGSSWLTDVLFQTGRLGKPIELFNPNHLFNLASSAQTDNLADYTEAAKRFRVTEGVNGFELTLYQLNRMFARQDGFVSQFGAGPHFWLIRRDIVAQAVSLAKMVTTQVSHSTIASAQQRQDAEASFDYSAKRIRHWLKHIAALEQETEGMFAKFGLNPVRLSYEQMMALGPNRTARLIGSKLGVEDLPNLTGTSRHTKLGTSKNQEFAERFRADQADFIAQVEANRRPWIEKLQDGA